MKKQSTKKKSMDMLYFEQARSWDAKVSKQLKASEKTAWFIAIICILVTSALALSISYILPLKTVEPYVVRVDSSTGIVDVITRVDTEKTIIDQSTQEAIDKYWLYKYIINRESYSWSTINQEREIIGTLSSEKEQNKYAAINNPNTNPNAPITIYGYDTSVTVKFKNITFLEKKARENTVIARIIKETKTKDYQTSTHWIIKITYSYFNKPIKQSIRYINPLGFQVLDYRIDPEAEN